jgi:hypothetical protein
MRAQFIATIFVCIVVLVLLAFTGDAHAFDPANVQDQVAITPAELAGATTLGQSFVFRYPRLRAIFVRAIVSDDFQATPDSLLTLHLRHRADAVADRATASVAINTIRHNDFIRFEFSPLDDSQDHAFYFFLDASRATITRGYLSVWASDRDAYPDGQLFLNARPGDGDLAFRADYALDVPIALQSLAREFSRHASALILTLIVFFLPGFFQKPVFLKKTGFSENFIIASFSGLAIISIAPLIFSSLNLRVPWIAVVALVVLCVAIFARDFGFARLRGFDLIVFAFAIFSIALGLLQIQGLAVPLWVDSPTHAGYIHTLVAEGRLPIASYHLGYHSIVALLAQMSGIAIPELMLVSGQTLITLTGLSVFVLSKKISGNSLGALASAICVWFLTPTPAYFISWGRYPLLWGGALLPIALVGALDLIEQPRATARAIFFAAITAVALAFAQIRLVAFYAIFVAVFFGVARLRGFVSNEQPAKASNPRVLARLAIIAAIGTAFIALWLASLFAGGIAFEKILEKNVGTVPIDLAVAFEVIFSHHGKIVALIAGLAALVAILARRRNALIVIAWFVALIASALIAGEYVSLSFVVLMAFLSASLLIGDLVAQIRHFERSEKSPTAFLRARSAPRPILLSFFVLTSVLGARDLVSIINPTTILFSRADAQAIEWIRTNTPTDARFLVNSFQWYGAYYVPSDGGAWLPYLANRASEFIALSPDFPRADADSLARWIAARRITHVYLGARAGILDEKIFAERYELLYRANSGAVYRVR